MPVELREIFNGVFDMLNIVATDTQKNAIFTTSCREFFSHVKPVYFKCKDEVNALILNDVPIKRGFKDDMNILSLDIGGFKIVEMNLLITEYYIKVEPLNFDNFKLDDNYIGAFQYVVEYFFKKVEKDNYGMLESAGIDTQEHIDIVDITTIRDYLKREFSFAIGRTII